MPFYQDWHVEHFFINAILVSFGLSSVTWPFKIEKFASKRKMNRMLPLLLTILYSLQSKRQIQTPSWHPTTKERKLWIKRVLPPKVHSKMVSTKGPQPVCPVVRKISATKCSSRACNRELWLRLSKNTIKMKRPFLLLTLNTWKTMLTQWES